MLIFAAAYLMVFALYAVIWQKRESEFVRTRLVEDFYRLSQTQPKSDEVKHGGVVYVMKNMDSPRGKTVRAEFRRDRMSELIIVGIVLVAAPVAVILSSVAATS